MSPGALPARSARREAPGQQWEAHLVPSLVSLVAHVYDPLRYTPRMDPGAPRTGGKLGKQLTFPGGAPWVRSEVNRICMLYIMRTTMKLC